ncbi:MAG: hypothetical protein ACREND_03155 [Gemmatimonadaceae bacterium]
MNGLVGLPELARELRKSYWTCYAAMLRGDLDGVREGKRWMVTRASADRLKHADSVRRTADVR